MLNRAHPRFAVAVEIEFVVGANPVRGRTTNLSKGGLCAEIERKIPLGEGVVARMALVFPDEDLSESIELGARVVWCTAINAGFQIGLQFTKPNAENNQDLDLFLRYLAARPD